MPLDGPFRLSVELAISRLRTWSIFSIIALMMWKWPKTTLAFGRFSATQAEQACDMSMHTYLILPLYLRSRQANCLSAFAPLPRVTPRTRPVTASRTIVTYLRDGRS